MADGYGSYGTQDPAGKTRQQIVDRIESTRRVRDANARVTLLAMAAVPTHILMSVLETTWTGVMAETTDVIQPASHRWRPPTQML